MTCGRREGDHAPRTAILIDALEDARALACEAVRRERGVGLLRSWPSRPRRAFRPGSIVATGRHRSRADARGRTLYVEVEAELDEPIVRQMRMAHTADLVTAAVSSAA